MSANQTPVKNISRQASLLSQRISAQKSQNSHECPICLQVIKVRGKIPCCNHEFCYTCICEWSKITNSCPLCKAGFNQIEKCEVDGSMLEGKTRRVIIHVEDKQQENDILAQEFVYDDCPFINEYIQDDFLVSDDAPILYATQLSDSTSLVNLLHYDSGSTTSFNMELGSDSSSSRRRSRRQQQRRLRISSQELERQQREESEYQQRLPRKRHRNVIFSEDDEDEIEEVEEVEEVENSKNSKNSKKEVIVDLSKDINEEESDLPQTPPLLFSQSIYDIHSSQNLQRHSTELVSEASAKATPILPSRTHSYTQQNPLPLPPAFCVDSYEDPLLFPMATASRSMFANLINRRCFSDSACQGLSIVPETPIREKRCRSESDRFVREKLSRMI